MNAEERGPLPGVRRRSRRSSRRPLTPPAARRSRSSAMHGRGYGLSGCPPTPTPRIGLRRGQPGDRHPERRAGHVVEADLVEQRDRLGVAAVLAADAELEVRAGRRGPARRRCATSSPTPSGRSSRTGCAAAGPARGRRGIMRPSTSSRLKPNVIWVRSLVPNEKKSATSAISSARSAARGVSIIVPIVTVDGPRRRRRAPSSMASSDPAAGQRPAPRG